jgi:hypothetical protein
MQFLVVRGTPRTVGKDTGRKREASRARLYPPAPPSHKPRLLAGSGSFGPGGSFFRQPPDGDEVGFPGGQQRQALDAVEVPGKPQARHALLGHSPQQRAGALNNHSDN